MLFFLLYKIGIFVAMVLPLGAAYRLASFVALIKYIFSVRDRKEMEANLKLVMPGKDAHALRAISKEIFINFSKYLVDFFRFGKLDVDYVNRHVEVVNRNHVDEALKKGKGVIILSAHLGNWELGGVTMGILGYKMNAVARGHKNKLVNDFFVNQRQRNNENVISIDIALRRCFSLLKNNEILAVVGDREFTNTGVTVKFFNKDTVLPKGAAVFSLKTGAAIVPGFVVRVKGGEFQLIFEKQIEYSPTGNFEADVVNLVALYAGVMENYIRRYPTQWYCFRRFWQ